MILAGISLTVKYLCFSGVRTFTPNNASTGFLYVGGPTVVLSLVAMAPDDSSLYAALKVLLSVLETNSAMQQEMNRINGYKVWLHIMYSINQWQSYRRLLFLSVICVPYEAVSFSSEDEEDTGQLQNLSVGSASHEFNGPELWIRLFKEHTCFPGIALRPRGKHSHFNRKPSDSL